MSTVKNAKLRGKNALGSRYKQAKTPEEYLDQRLDKSGDCWIFTRGKDKNGYGQVQASSVAKALKVTRAHQMAYVAWVAEIPEGMLVCHTCDNPSCCNPDHLFLGTNRDNVHDMINKGRARYPERRVLDYAAIVSQYGLKPCEVVAEEFGCSFGTVCKIWRKHGLRGRNFYAYR